MNIEHDNYMMLLLYRQKNILRHLSHITRYNVSHEKSLSHFQIAVNFDYKVPSPRHLLRGKLSPVHKLMTPSTHSISPNFLDSNESP
jgi:hypothetical protein